MSRGQRGVLTCTVFYASYPVHGSLSTRTIPPRACSYGSISDSLSVIVIVADIKTQFTRIIIGIQVLSAGVTLPSKFVSRRRVQGSLAILLGPVMLVAVLLVGCFCKA